MDGGTKFKFKVPKEEDPKFLTLLCFIIMCVYVIWNACYLCVMWYVCVCVMRYVCVCVMWYVCAYCGMCVIKWCCACCNLCIFRMLFLTFYHAYLL